MAFEFDGLLSGINFGNPPSIPYWFYGGGTLMAWIHPYGWGQGGYGRIMNRTSISGTGMAWYVTEINDEWGNTSSVSFSATATPPSSDVGVFSAPANSIDLNKWTHCAITLDSTSVSNLPIMYINGQAVTVSEKQSPQGSYNSVDVYNIYVGSRNALDRFFNGMIEDIRGYNRILSASEISLIYHNAGRDNILTNLRAHWTLSSGYDGLPISVVHDLSNNHIDGLATNVTARPGLHSPYSRRR